MAMVVLFATAQAVQGAPLVQAARRGDDPIVVQPPCDEGAFDTALILVKARGKGTIVFNCGAATINFTSVKKIEQPTTIDGAGQITLSGGNSTQLFQVDAGEELTPPRVTLRLVTLPATAAPSEQRHADRRKQHDREQQRRRQRRRHRELRPAQHQRQHAGKQQRRQCRRIFPRFPAATTTIVNSNLVDNHATSTTDGWGGAILAWDGANVTVQGGAIAGNTARIGGGIHNRFANSTITFRGVLVLGNQTKTNTLTADLAGGGIYNGPGTVTVENSVFGDNDAAWTGGGIYNSGGVVAVSDSTFVRNTALADGGALSNAGEATVTGTLFRNNSSVSGSTVSNWSELLVQNSTFSGNRVQEKGVFINYGEAVIQNATFSDNLDETGQSGASQILQFSQQPLRLKNVVLKVFVGGFGGVNCSASNSTGDAPIGPDGFNVSDDTSCSTYFTNAGDKNNINPKLGPLADNGGPTMTHLPLVGSPLIDGGQCIVGLTTDERGA